MADLIDRPASAMTPVSRGITPAPSAEVAVDKLLTCDEFIAATWRVSRTTTWLVVSALTWSELIAVICEVLSWSTWAVVIALNWAPDKDLS